MAWDEGEIGVADRPEDEALLGELRERRERAEKQAEIARVELRRAERIVVACSAAIEQLDDPEGASDEWNARLVRRA